MLQALKGLLKLNLLEYRREVYALECVYTLMLMMASNSSKSVCKSGCTLLGEKFNFWGLSYRGMSLSILLNCCCCCSGYLDAVSVAKCKLIVVLTGTNHKEGGVRSVGFIRHAKARLKSCGDSLLEGNIFGISGPVLYNYEFNLLQYPDWSCARITLD